MKKKNYKVIGISAMTFQAEDAKFLIKKIRKWLKNIIIVVGGVHFSALPQDGINSGADYVIRGEGEITLLHCLNNGFPTDKKIIQGETIKNLDDIPMIKMSDIQPFIKSPERYYYKGLQTITARGCPYNCNFCLGRDQRPKGLRYHSIDSIIEFIHKIVKTFKITSFNIVDDIFVIKKSRVIEFCEKVKERISTNLRFHAFTHAGHGDLNLYRKMKEAGFHRISIGAEHGNADILEIMGKNITKAQIRRTTSQIFEAGIDANLLYVLGNIKETNETISETIDFAIFLHKKYNTTSWFSYMQPLPGSPVYEVAKKFGNFINRKHIYHNIDLCYVPFRVSYNHIIKERERGMIQANFPAKTEITIIENYSFFYIFKQISVAILKSITRKNSFELLYNIYEKIMLKGKN